MRARLSHNASRAWARAHEWIHRRFYSSLSPSRRQSVALRQSSKIFSLLNRLAQKIHRSLLCAPFYFPLSPVSSFPIFRLGFQLAEWPGYSGLFASFSVWNIKGILSRVSKYKWERLEYFHVNCEILYIYTFYRRNSWLFLG